MALNLLYRLNQKLKYHASNDPFEKKVAEINRYESIISYNEKTFRIKGIPEEFNRAKHSFLIHRLDLIEALSGQGQFQIIDQEVFYFIKQLKLRVTTAEEVFIIHEIFIEQCYHVVAPWNYNVIDIGMNVGFASLSFAINSQINKVFSFEPFKPTFDDGAINFAANASIASKIIPHNYGWAKKSGLIKSFFSAETKGKNSIVTDVSSSHEQTIELRTASDELYDILKKEEGYYFIKMDCEGAEFEIFEDFEVKGIPDDVFGFIIEWHQKDPAPIVKVLVDNNFVVQMSGNTQIGLLTAFRNAPIH